MIGLAVGLITGRRELVAAIVGAGVAVGVGARVEPVDRHRRRRGRRAAGRAARPGAARTAREPARPTVATLDAGPIVGRRRPPMSTDLVLLAVLMFAVTYPTRALGLLTPGLDRLPKIAFDYLQLVGPAVLAALAAVSVMVVVGDDDVPSFHVGIEWVAVLVCLAIVALAPEPAPRAWSRRSPSWSSPGRPGWPRSRPETPSLATRRSAAARLDLDLDEQARVDQRADLDQRGGRPDVAEDLAVDRGDLAGGGDVGHEHPRPHDVGEGEAGLGQGALDDRRGPRGPGRPMSPGWSDAPSGPASVVPATQHESPTTIARL